MSISRTAGETACSLETGPREAMAQQNPAATSNIDGILKTIETNHDEAFLYVSQGLSYEEKGENALAIEMYYKGLEKLANGLSPYCDHPSCKGPLWVKARNMQRKMRRIKDEVEFRLIAIEQAGGAPLYADRPPTYDEATSANTARPPRREAEELFCIESGVQIFYVSAGGGVEAPPEPTDLHVYRLPGRQDAMFPDEKAPLPWLQVGTWIYPLVPKQSPALKSGFGAYLFPNIDAPLKETGAAVGVLLPSDLPHEMISLFESLMEELTAMKIEILDDTCFAICSPGSFLSRFRRSTDSFSQQVSDTIVAGSEVLSKGLTKGAMVTGEALKMGAARLKQYLKPDPEPLAVDPRVKQGLEILRTVTGSARSVTERVANKVGELTVKVAQMVATNVACENCVAGPPDLPSTSMDKVQGAITIAKGGLQGLSTVYVGLENAAKILATSLANETVEVVGHKYGTDAAQVVDNAMNSVTNVTMATYAFRGIGLKPIAKRTAKETGKAILQEYLKKKAAFQAQDVSEDSLSDL
ncbi:spartin isoform X2 [Rhipicephalus sanguineus]|uniref:spartin isoform X2 n=1 Tax=Rhipicephalus sanguineus TaxID=34632 RepID=UPI001894AC48|nr:spartin isoform X2 [Rhipicephalus sanguineus]